MNRHTNIVRLKAVNNALAGLGQKFVFVGGAVVALYADRVADEIRETDDVDVLVEVYTQTGYTQMEEQLHKLGFKLDTTAKFMGRYTIDNLIVDFMPMEKNILGFSNTWYKEGFANAESAVLDDAGIIQIFTAPYFIAAKLEAFKNRGKNEQGEYDGRLSTDFEDIVFLLVYRKSIYKEMQSASANVKAYLQQQFSTLIANPYFEEWVDAHADFNALTAQEIVLPGLRGFLSDRAK